MQEIELKSCPFCGGKAVLHVNEGVCVVCRKCGCKTITQVDCYSSGGEPQGSAIYRVANSWNRRT